MGQTFDYAIIVPAYNEQRQLALTLPVMRQAMAGVGARGELVVVDNNSSDATAAVATEHGARVVFEPVNMIAKARNAGARATVAAKLVFIDADSTPTVELLGAALGAMDEPGCVGGGARVSLFPKPGWCAEQAARLWNALSRVAGLPAGCFFFCRREAFDAVGGFSEAVYASEEIWLARRLKKWGRPRGMKMRILEAKVTTSSRKLESLGPVLLMLAVMFVFPFAVRFRRFCGFWYDRKDAPDAG